MINPKNVRMLLWWAWWVVAWVVLIQSSYWVFALVMFLWNPFDDCDDRGDTDDDLYSDDVIEPVNMRKPNR